VSFEARADRAGRDRVLLLRGRILADHLGELQRQIGHCSPLALDLGDVTLVGRVVVDFLARCEAKNVALRRCPRYIREWITTEKAQRASDLSSPADRGR
jgi:hypothetical protein